MNNDDDDYDDVPRMAFGVTREDLDDEERLAAGDAMDVEDGDDDDAESFRPSFGGSCVLSKARSGAYARKPAMSFVSAQKRARASDDENHVAPARKLAPDSTSQPVHKVAQWEKHTKGIGSKLLQKMGWQPGKALGNAQGLTAPIEVKQRPRGMGLAYRDFKEKVVVKEQVVKPDEAKAAKKENWKRNRTVRVQYKTVDEILAQELGETTTPDKVVDMRKPAELVPTESIYLPELRFNLALLADKTDSDVRRMGQSLHQELRTSAELDRLVEQKQHQINAMASTVGRLEQALEFMAKLESVDRRDLQDFVRTFRAEIVEYRLAAVAVALLSKQVHLRFDTAILTPG
jgi:hypothetical protein